MQSMRATLNKSNRDRRIILTNNIFQYNHPDRKGCATLADVDTKEPRPTRVGRSSRCALERYFAPIHA